MPCEEAPVTDQWPVMNHVRAGTAPVVSCHEVCLLPRTYCPAGDREVPNTRSRRRLSSDSGMQVRSLRPPRPGMSREIQMAKSDDHSTGDDRKPYSDIGGPEAKHAQTHDVDQEEATNSAPKVDEPDEFANDLANDNR